MVLTDLEICILALGNTYNMKKMEKLLPYGVKNRLKWKNGIFLKRCGNQIAQKIEMLDEKEKQVFDMRNIDESIWADG